MMCKQVTLKDIAGKSEYSLRTVKKVMSGDRSVRPETREKILAAAAELGYKKNMTASALGMNKMWTIAIVLGRNKYFFSEAKAGFLECQKTWKDLKVELQFFVLRDGSPQSEKDVLREILENSQIDAVIIHVMNEPEVNEEINALVESGKTVCTFGVDAPESKRLFYVGPKAYGTGRIAAQVMARFIRRDGKVYVVLSTHELLQNSRRMKGVFDYMQEKHPEIPVQCIEVEDSGEDFHRKMAELMSQRDVAGIIGINADAYIVGEEARKAGRKDIVTLGFDLNEDTEQMVREGYFDAILEQAPEHQADMALDNLCRYLLYRSEVKNIYTDVVLVTSEMLRYREEDDGAGN